MQGWSLPPSLAHLLSIKPLHVHSKSNLNTVSWPCQLHGNIVPRGCGSKTGLVNGSKRQILWSWWLNFDPHPCVHALSISCAVPRRHRSWKCTGQLREAGVRPGGKEACQASFDLEDSMVALLSYQAEVKIAVSGKKKPSLFCRPWEGRQTQKQTSSNGAHLATGHT